MDGAALFLDGGVATVQMTDNLFEGNTATAGSDIHLNGGLDGQWTGMQFEYNTVAGNVAADSDFAGAPTTMDVWGNPIIEHNNLLDTSNTYEVADANGMNSLAIDATNHWWNTTDDATISARVFDYALAMNHGVVSYVPYLDVARAAGAHTAGRRPAAGDGDPRGHGHGVIGRKRDHRAGRPHGLVHRVDR